jgi:hypothetical protein
MRTVMQVPLKSVSSHARATDPLEDRDEHEDADQKEETRGGARVIGKPRKITTDGEDEFVCPARTSRRNSCTSAVL